MLRRVFTILSILSLALCVATFALWVRCRSTVEFGFAESSRTGFAVKTTETGVEGVSVVYREKRDDRHLRYLSFFHNTQDNIVAPLNLVGSDDPVFESHEPSLHFGFGVSAKEGRYPRRISTGLAFNNFELPSDPNTPADYRFWYLATPYWALILLLAILPTIRILQWRKRRSGVSTGNCLACGYDLRATPGQCPECGKETKSPLVKATRN
jgi:hypothetical protein